MAWVVLGCLTGCSTIVEFGETDSSTTEGSTQAATTEDPFLPGTSGPGDPLPGTTTQTPPTPTTSPTPDPPDGCGFLGCDDLPSDGIPCDIWNDRCPEDMKCNPVALYNRHTWNAHRCVPLAQQPDGVGEPCTVLGENTSGVDTCERGAMCWNIADGQGICTPHCDGTPRAPHCEGDRICGIDGDGTVNLCDQPCNPLEPTPCSLDHESCLYDHPARTFVCRLGWGDDAKPPLSSCTYDNECVPGSACLYVEPSLCPGEGQGCCTPLCDLDDPVCPEGALCSPFFEPDDTPRGHEDLGYCTPL